MQFCIKPVRVAAVELDLRSPCFSIEGDLEKNAKLWYQQVPDALLAAFWTPTEQLTSSEAAVENMYRIMLVKGGKSKEGEEDEVRRVKWNELCVVMAELERRLGWEVVEGTTVYTKDKDPSHKSMVLGESIRRTRACHGAEAYSIGEGYRTWDRSGLSSR